MLPKLRIILIDLKLIMLAIRQRNKRLNNVFNLYDILRIRTISEKIIPLLRNWK